MNLLKLFIRTMRVMGKRWFLYMGAIFMMSVSLSMFSVFSSLLMKRVVDIAPTGDMERLFANILAIVAGGTLSLLIYKRAGIIYNVEAKRVYGVIYEKVLDLEMKLPYSYYEQHHSGEIMSKVSFDLGRMGDIYGSRFRRVVMPFLQVVVYLVPMLMMGWQLTLCLVAVNAAMLAADMLLAEPMRKASRELSGINNAMTKRLSDLLQGMEQARMYEAGRGTVEDYLKENGRYIRKSNHRTLLAACLESSSRGSDLLCSLVFLLVGVSFVQKGYATLGGLAAIYTLYGSFSGQFLLVGKYLPELIAYLAYAQNIFDFLEEEREPPSWYGLENVLGKQGRKTRHGVAVSMQDVEFSYGPGTAAQDKLLDKFSMEIGTGECVAVTGPSGCGKTTVSKLLIGLYPVSGGEIFINGRNVKGMTNAEWRSCIAYVPQEPYLFNTSIRENIRMGRPGASDSEIVEAAKLANAHDFIMDMEDGYGTLAGERGNRLSGGQRQRIAIARAIIKRAPILLMDEATSALDNESEQLVNDALKILQKQVTVIMIAHRPSTVQLAGRMVGMGTGAGAHGGRDGASCII